MNRRQFLIGSSALAGSAAFADEEKTTDGGFAEVSWADRHVRDTPLLPAGAGSAERFAVKCVGCGLCAAACPSRILRPSAKPSRAGRVEIDLRYGWCKPGCVKCGEVCPAGAIERLTVREKRDVHTGYAVWRKDLCIRTTEEEDCHACEKHCPVKAVKLVAGFPVVDRDVCIGCGACEHYCPARPATAIRVTALDRHREVVPISEADLVSEMRTLLREGKTFVVAKNGVIVFQSEAHLTAPIDEALASDPELLRGAVVMDKVVGKAAAKKHIAAGVRRLFTCVCAEKAKAMLEKAGVEVTADEIVPKILNRDRTGECPLDAAVSGEM